MIDQTDVNTCKDSYALARWLEVEGHEFLTLRRQNIFVAKVCLYYHLQLFKATTLRLSIYCDARVFIFGYKKDLPWCLFISMSVDWHRKLQLVLFVLLLK